MTTWTLKKFDELTPHELYAILQLRSEVFVVEQNCVYQDMDNKDLKAWHLMGWDSEASDRKLLAHTRLLPPGLSYPEASIGRVVSSPTVRGKGIGRELMNKSIETIYILYGAGPIRIGAQLYLKSFYASLGFQPEGDIYLEDNIQHIIMYLP
jgi:ElaA protein